MGVTKVGYLPSAYSLLSGLQRSNVLEIQGVEGCLSKENPNCRWLLILHYWLLPSITFQSRVHRRAERGSMLGYLSDERPIVGGCRLLSRRPKTEIFQILWIWYISSSLEEDYNLQILIKSSTHLDLWPVGATWMTGAPCLKPPRRRSAERDLRQSNLFVVYFCVHVCVCVCLCVYIRA